MKVANTLPSQIILIDLAYNWNDAWVANADADERDEPGSGAAWLKALLFVSAFIMVLSYTALGFLIHFFASSLFASSSCSPTLASTWLSCHF